VRAHLIAGAYQVAVHKGGVELASRKTLNATNLQALGKERLADLLLDLAAADPAVKRRLRLELAAASSPQDIGREVRKRLATIRRAKSFLDYRGVRDLAGELKGQKALIVETIAPSAPAEALDLMWQLMDLAAHVLQRCDDSNGVLGDVFRSTVPMIGELAKASGMPQEALAQQVFQAVRSNRYGEFDGLVTALAPALGQAGLARLKLLAQDLAAQVPQASERRIVGRRLDTGQAVFAADIEDNHRRWVVTSTLQAVADAEGDVDGFIAQIGPKARLMPKVAAEIAHRLLAAGRAEEALAALDQAQHKRRTTRKEEELLDFFYFVENEWEDARLAILEALDRPSDAQAFRWALFEQRLAAEHLRAFLKRLPDFDDIEAERRALDYAEQFINAHVALHFLVTWPALERAARLTQARLAEIDGDHYPLLAPAADALETKYPLAATLLRRAMIDFSLNRARSSRYKHAAKHFRQCESLAAQITDFGAFPDHAGYAAGIKAKHGRKSGFWSLLR